MEKRKEIDIDGERVFVRKKYNGGYRIVHPNKIDGKIVWKNLIAGGKWNNLLFIAGIVLLLIGSILEYVNAVRIANDCLAQSPFYILP